MLILDEAAVRKFLDMRALIPAMERASSALSAGKAVQPVRVMVPVAKHGGFLGWIALNSAVIAGVVVYG